MAGERCGIDITHVFTERLSSNQTVITVKDMLGDMLFWSDGIRAYAYLTLVE